MEVSLKSVRSFTGSHILSHELAEEEHKPCRDFVNCRVCRFEIAAQENSQGNRGILLSWFSRLELRVFTPFPAASPVQLPTRTPHPRSNGSTAFHRNGHHAGSDHSRPPSAPACLSGGRRTNPPPVSAARFCNSATTAPEKTDSRSDCCPDNHEWRGSSTSGPGRGSMNFPNQSDDASSDSSQDGPVGAAETADVPGWLIP